jgi:hypothetical protein
VVAFLVRSQLAKLAACLKVQGRGGLPPILSPGRLPGCGVARFRALLSQDALTISGPTHLSTSSLPIQDVHFTGAAHATLSQVCQVRIRPPAAATLRRRARQERRGLPRRGRGPKGRDRPPHISFTGNAANTSAAWRHDLASSFAARVLAHPLGGASAGAPRPGPLAQDRTRGCGPVQLD